MPHCKSAPRCVINLLCLPVSTKLGHESSCLRISGFLIKFDVVANNVRPFYAHAKHDFILSSFPQCAFVSVLCCCRVTIFLNDKLDSLQQSAEFFQASFPLLGSHLHSTVAQHNPAQHSHRISVSPDAFHGPVLFLMIQRFVFHFEVVIMSTPRTGHVVQFSLLPHSLCM